MPEYFVAEGEQVVDATLSGGGRVFNREGEEQMGTAYPPTKGQPPVSALDPQPAHMYV